MAQEQLQNKSGRKGTCPDHGEIELIEELIPIKTGIDQVVRKIMRIGKCPVQGCTRWCEMFLDYSVWV